MASVEHYREHEFFVWEYERLRVIGVLGRLERLLDNVILPHNPDTMEFATIKREGHLHRDFLAGFHFSPPVDFTMVRSYNREASIVTYSLDKQKPKELIRNITRTYGLSLDIPSEAEQSFTEEISFDINACAESSWIFSDALMGLFFA